MTYPSEIPPFFNEKGKPLIRGTEAWDARELAREKSGCNLLSYGTLNEALATKGGSSKARLTRGNIKKARENGDIKSARKR